MLVLTRHHFIFVVFRVKRLLVVLRLQFGLVESAFAAQLVESLGLEGGRVALLQLGEREAVSHLLVGGRVGSAMTQPRLPLGGHLGVKTGPNVPADGVSGGRLRAYVPALAATFADTARTR